MIISVTLKSLELLSLSKDEEKLTENEKKKTKKIKFFKLIPGF
jgi:hypothetical protein|tara:strand:+ start:325 stop:453 length:129 start_codon:yes stop_codon:yes gene_type:complete